MKIRLYLFFIAQLITVVVFGQEELIEKRVTIAPTGLGNSHIPYSTGDVYLSGFTGDGGGAFIYRTFDGTGYVNRFRVAANGNVGIGTSNPSSKLDIVNSGNGASLLRLSTERPWEFIQVGNAPAAFLALRSIVDNKSFIIQSPLGVRNSIFNVSDTPEDNKVLFLTEGGKMGIGTTNPTHKLSVNGTIRAKEVKVETGWSDFVFEENYQLRSLSEVESFIQKNGHLPDIPSAEEVAESGVNVGEMESKLLQKIEELTLYVIEQEKEIDSSNQLVQILMNRLKSLENEIEKLKSEQ